MHHGCDTTTHEIKHLLSARLSYLRPQLNQIAVPCNSNDTVRKSCCSGINVNYVQSNSLVSIVITSGIVFCCTLCTLQPLEGPRQDMPSCVFAPVLAGGVAVNTQLPGVRELFQAGSRYCSYIASDSVKASVKLRFQHPAMH